MKQNRKLRNKFTHLPSTHFYQRHQEDTFGKDSIFNKLLGKHNTHMYKNKPRPLSYHIQKSTQNKDLNVEPETTKLPEKKKIG